ncbi:hypothetical protein VTK56DRAFT_3852 [Thermocarpiscus australiensis]
MAASLEAVKTQEESVQFLREADASIDVERLTGVTVREEAEQLRMARAVLDDLNAQLGEAIAAWSYLPQQETRGENPPWPQLPGPPPPLSLVPEQQQLPPPRKTSRFFTPNMTDPTDQLEKAARVAKSNRGYFPAHHQSFAQEHEAAQMTSGWTMILILTFGRRTSALEISGLILLDLDQPTTGTAYHPERGRKLSAQQEAMVNRASVQWRLRKVTVTGGLRFLAHEALQLDDAKTDAQSGVILGQLQYPVNTRLIIPKH